MVRLQLIRVLLGFAAVTALELSSLPAQSQTSTFDQIIARGTMVVGVRTDYPPTGYLDLEGKNVGFGPDIARELAKHLGVKVQFVSETSQTRIQMLQNGQMDVAISSSTPTRTRNEVLDFTYPYIWDRGVILVKKGASTKIADYANDKVLVGNLQGATAFNEDWKRVSPNAQMRFYQETPDIFIALSQGKIDVAIVNESIARLLLQKMGRQLANLEIGEVVSWDPQAIAVRQNDSKWRNWLDWALQRLWADGTFQALYKKNYLIDPPFHFWDNGQLQPGVLEIGKQNDKW